MTTDFADMMCWARVGPHVARDAAWAGDLMELRSIAQSEDLGFVSWHVRLTEPDTPIDGITVCVCYVSVTETWHLFATSRAAGAWAHFTSSGQIPYVCCAENVFAPAEGRAGFPRDVEYLCELAEAPIYDDHPWK